jgi:hypothetical protein
VPSLHHSELYDAAEGADSGETAAAEAAGGSGAAGAGVDRSGALPMLTPPSDTAAGDRSAKGRHSPVPFRLNSLGTAQEAAAAAAVGDAEAAPEAAEPQQQQKQPQPGRQSISHLFKMQQQQQQERGGLLGGSSLDLSPAAAAAAAGGGGGGGGHKPSRLDAAGALASHGSSSMSPPGLPEVGSAPGTTFWKQLVSNIVCPQAQWSQIGMT